jgi:hypothetical protein
MKEWQSKLLDRILAALAAALVTAAIGYLEKMNLRKELKETNRAWDESLEYFRKP